MGELDLIMTIKSEIKHTKWLKKEQDKFRMLIVKEDGERYFIPVFKTDTLHDILFKIFRGQSFTDADINKIKEISFMKEEDYEEKLSILSKTVGEICEESSR